MDSKTVFSFLHDHFLFKFLSDDELGQLLPLFNPISLEEGEVLYRAGFPGRNFFLVVSGKVLIEDENQNGIIINPRGHFGDKELLREGMRKETASALEDTTLLAVNKRGFIAILSAYPSIRTRLSALKLSANILQRNDFPWIGPEEIIRFIDRKHINVLYGQLLLPALFLILTGIGAILLHLNLGIFLAITILISIIWGVWLWLDWRNDFYLVTSDRAAWVEKVIWLHAEAQKIAKARSQQTDKENINQAIRSRLGLSGETGPMDEEEDYTDLVMEGGPQLTETITPLQEFINLFRARYELDGVINYRKHIFILFKNSWWLWLLFVLLLVSFFARLVQLIPIPSLSLLIILLTVNVLGLAYAFADWANDRFQITDKQVIDLDRKPFGRETKRSALLENILSLDYRRENIIQRIFDFGTVAINVGDIQLDFEHVAQPISVQNEVFERYNAVIKENERGESMRRRDDMVEFLAAYHEENNNDIEPLDGDETILL